MSASFAQKKLYESVFGEIPKGYHIHRIKPGYEGGKYEIGNMVAVSIAVHVQLHKDRYEQYGDKRDYTAFKLMEEKRGLTSYERSSLGGTISGQFKNSEFQSAQGKKGGSKGLGEHVNKEKYAESRVFGGIASAQKAKEQKKGSLYMRVICEFCNKDIRLTDKRWHKEGVCLTRADKK